MQGCTVLHGHARFEAACALRVGDRLISAPRIFLNVGSRAHVPDMPGVAEVPYLTNTSILGLSEVPRHLVIVGGSYIGLEFAQMYRRFGATVTVIEKGRHLVGRGDDDVSAAVKTILEDEGVTVRTGAACISLATDGDRVAVQMDCQQGPPVVSGSHVLRAVGRRPNTDDQLATSVPGIWAIGDCNGRGAFTHTACNDFEIVAGNLLDGETRLVSARIPAHALYIDPPA